MSRPTYRGLTAFEPFTVHMRQATLAAACALVAACSPSPDAAADIAAIAQVNERILSALNAGDWARLNELTDESYVAIIGGAAIQGKDQLEAANQRFLEQWQDEEHWLPEETLVDGDLAVQRGSFTMKLTPRSGGESRDLAGTYVHVYQRKPDGAWALTRAMAAERTRN
jgi:ketosteroid isomerase-like protein